MSTIRRVGLVANPSKIAARPLIAPLVERLGGRGIRVIVSPETAALLEMPSGVSVAPDMPGLSECDLLLVLGGDGTLLHTVREVGPTRALILGINVGGLGFLTEVHPGEAAAALDQVLDGDFEVEDRRILNGQIEDESGRATRTLTALNDIVVDEGSSTRRAVVLRLSLSGMVISSFTGDGVIVATPSGSTAYNLSAGGPILGPGVRDIVVTPICPHTMSVRPMVFPDDRVLLVEDLRPDLQVKVTADGQVSGPVPRGGRVRIAPDPARVARFVRVKRRSYYEVLRLKLGWGGPGPNV